MAARLQETGSTTDGRSLATSDPPVRPAPTTTRNQAAHAPAPLRQWETDTARSLILREWAVRQIDDGMRWKFLPPHDPASLTWPALFVRIEGHPEAPEPPNDLFDTAKLVGVLHRAGGKHPLEAFSVFLVSAPTAKFLSGIAE